MNITKTTLLRYLIGTVVCAFSAQTISAEGTKLPYWKDIQTVAVNKEAPRTAFMSYDNSGQALTGKYENSPYYKLLNGKWNFYYVDAYKDLPANIEQPGADITWKEINVPATGRYKDMEQPSIPISHTISSPATRNLRICPRPIR